MIEISVNNLPTSIEENTRLDIFLKNFGSHPDYAVALNGEFIPRTKYQTTTLKNNDKLDIVSPVGGG